VHCFRFNGPTYWEEALNDDVVRPSVCLSPISTLNLHSPEGATVIVTMQQSLAIGGGDLIS